MADDGGEVLGFKALFSFEGRINRGTFWKVFVLTIVGVVAAGVIAAIMIPKLADPAAGVETGDNTTALVLIVAVYIVVLWTSLATQVKRWHDMDKSGWMVLLNLIPVVGFFVFLYLGFNPGSQGPNRFGTAPVRILM